ncbi:MAG TPA: hypothetical protein VH722_06855 [Alphaproteobacteria bacterium]|nr:hypothetical protein [Alphaproteobacteria bacterium]
MTTDLRDVPADEYWQRFNAMVNGDGGLLTYRYLGRKTAMLHGEPYDTMRIRRDMRSASGAIMAAPLAIASAEAGGFSDVDSIPAPVTAALHIIDDGLGVTEIAMRRTPIHVGRTMGFSQCEIVDAADPARVLAISYGSGIRLADAPAGFQPLDLPPDIEDRPGLPPLTQVFGAGRRPDGVWALPAMTPENMSTSGSLHLGPTHIVLEAAATELAEQHAGTNAIRIEDWTVMFVARGTNGPFVVEGTVSTGNYGRIACSLSLRDQGRDGRTVATAVAMYRRI